MRLRNLLFVPADSARKVVRALASPADAVILDLEDSVAAHAKAAAREAAAAVLAASDRRDGVVVRVNSRDSGWYLADLAPSFLDGRAQSSYPNAPVRTICAPLATI